MAMAHRQLTEQGQFVPFPSGDSRSESKSGNAFISGLFTPFFFKNYRRTLYQRHHYDSPLHGQRTYPLLFL